MNFGTGKGKNMKSGWSVSSEKNKERLQLLDDIDKTKFALECAYSNFDNVIEPDLIDCYIYEVNSSLKRYKYLLEQAAKLNLLPEESNQKSSIFTDLIQVFH